MKLTVEEMVEAADREIETITIQQAEELRSSDQCIFVDIRDIRELQKLSLIHI